MIQRLRNLALLAPLFLTACTGVGHHYGYTVARKTLPWGEVAASLQPESTYDRDGILLTNGPYRFVVTVFVSDASAVPMGCRARFGEIALLDTKGAVEARIAPSTVSRLTSPTPAEDSQGAGALMYVYAERNQIFASPPRITVDVPYRDHQIAVDVVLEGCGEADGAYKLRDMIKTDYKTWRFNPALSALLSV